MTGNKIEKHKEVLRSYLDGYGVDTQNAIIMALLLFGKQKPKKAITIEFKSSQACPVCESNVSQTYCPNCGQKISYS